MPPAAEVPRSHRQFPPAVRNYVKRSFAPENEISCVNNSELQEKLREVLTKAAENHELDVIDWEQQALPQVMIQDERSKILSNNNTEVSSQKSPSSDDSRKRNLADHSQDRHQRIDSQRYDVIDIPSLNREPPGGPHTLIDPHASTRAPARDFQDVQDQDQGRRDMYRDWTVGELRLAVEDLLSDRTSVQHNRRASTTSGRSATNSRNGSDHSEPGPVISDQCKDIEAIDQHPAPIPPQVPDFDTSGRLGTDNDGDPATGQSQRTFPVSGQLHSTTPLTDSGHASISYDEFGNRAMLPEKEHSAELLNDSQNIPSEKEVPAPADAEFTSKNAEDEDDNDAQSIYTVEPKISRVKHKDFISKVANDLFEKVILEENAHRTPEIIQGVVPRLLKGFALRAGQSDSTQMQRDLMVFIRRHRREIAGSLRMKYLENEGDSQIPEYDDDRMDLDEIMNLWHHNLEDAGSEVDTPQKEINSASETGSSREDVFTEDSGSEIPEFATYKKLISNSSAYYWLLGTINRNLYLNPAEPNS
ncbi:purine and uridine phosphorylase [Penicillium angulare]|uniref:Purine and uridine phosphorylase n=1 Tax=Penicillium angulare TaxID=116970 RepID=A0A9W9FI58_9EURO|nr:purine and uridine phosphorylase [Penicillium angulare]